MIERKKIEIYRSREEELYSCLRKFPKVFMEELSIEGSRKNNHLLEKGSRVEGVYLILEGEFRVINPIQTGQNFCFAKGSGPDVLGLMEVFGEKESYASTIHTLEDCRYIKIPSHYFLEWVERDKDIMRLFFKILSNKFYDSSFKSGEVFLNSNIYNFTNYLLEEAGEGVEREGIGIIDRSKQQIADLLGTSIRTVFRSIESYRKKGFLDVAEGNIHIDRDQFYRLKEHLKNIT